MFSRVKLFLSESRQEIKKVNWPSRTETIRYTLFVVVFSVALSIFLGVLDFAFLNVLERVIL